MSEARFLRPEEARRRLGITDESLRHWARDGKISFIRTKGGHRRYDISSVVGPESSMLPSPQARKCICYARVSSAGQKEDLERQVQFFRTKFPNHEIIQDIGSGLNFKRKGFRAILGLALGGHIQELVVTYKDRLLRFGFELMREIIRVGKGKIVVLNQDEEQTPEQELCSDLLSIVTVLSARIHGFRSHRNRKALVNPPQTSQERKGETGIGESLEN